MDSKGVATDIIASVPSSTTTVESYPSVVGVVVDGKEQTVNSVTPVNADGEKPASIDEKNDNNVLTNDSNVQDKTESPAVDVPYMSYQPDGASLGSSIINMMNTIVGAGVL